jgi:type IV secretion system protein VirD4
MSRGTEVVKVAPSPPTWQGFFLGRAMTPLGEPLFAGRQQALLVIGPPRSGKTSAVVVPNLLTAPGALVTTSTKTDIIAWSSKVRSLRGTTWLFDPSGTLDAGQLTALRWSPVTGCERWEVAVSRAHSLATTAQPGRTSGGADHWVERAEALLGPLLHAAALGGRGMASVLRWVQRRDVQEAIELAGSGNGHEIAADSIQGILETEDRERSGIFSTAANILSAYRLPAALQSASDPNFDPEAFVRSSDTVYVCFPTTEQEHLAPLVVAFLETVRRATYARGPDFPPVSFVLDEVANIAPLPNLPALVSEGGGQGLVTLACLQDLSQARARWGVAADGFLTLFGTKLFLPGVADLKTLQLVSTLAGEHYAAMHSYTKGGNPIHALLGGPPVTTSKTTYYQREPVLPVDQVARIAPGTALVMWPGTPPVQVGLVPAWQDPWKAVIDRAATLALAR